MLQANDRNISTCRVNLRLLRLLFYCTGILALHACATAHDPLDDFEAHTPTTIMDAPPPRTTQPAGYTSEQVNKGKYLVELLGCGSCHTDGALVGTPNKARQLAGSRIGIAYSNPLQVKYPGVLYPANLTPDNETGIGTWTNTELLTVIRHGVDRHGRKRVSVMPWPAYAKLRDDDAAAIVAYLRSLAPVAHRVPSNVSRGNKTTDLYVHFGVYSSRR